MNRYDIEKKLHELRMTYRLIIRNKKRDLISVIEDIQKINKEISIKEDVLRKLITKRQKIQCSIEEQSTNYARARLKQIEKLKTLERNKLIEL